MPKIYRELWNRFVKDGEIAPDATMGHYLRIDREGGRFNEQAITQLIGSFKSTIAFAKPDSSAKMSEEPGEDEDPDAETEGDEMETAAEIQPPKPSGGNPPPPPAGTIPLTVLMDDQGTVRIINLPRMSEEAFAFFESQLKAFKRAIILPADKPADQ